MLNHTEIILWWGVEESRWFYFVCWPRSKFSDVKRRLSVTKQWYWPNICRYWSKKIYQQIWHSPFLTSLQPALLYSTLLNIISINLFHLCFTQSLVNLLNFVQYNIAINVLLTLLLNFEQMIKNEVFNLHIGQKAMYSISSCAVLIWHFWTTKITSNNLNGLNPPVLGSMNFECTDDAVNFFIL